MTGDQGDDAAVMIGCHDAAEVGGAEVLGLAPSPLIQRHQQHPLNGTAALPEPMSSGKQLIVEFDGRIPYPVSR